jgi:protein SCO1/2
VARRGPVVLAAALLLLAGCSSASGGSSDDGDGDGLHGTRLGQPYAAPAAPLTDTEGAAYSLTDQTDKPLTLVFFGYTNCPDICQMVMANIASALTRLDADEQKRVDVAYVTTDPARDDEATLRDYLARFGDGLVGLTGTMPQILDVGESFHIYIDKGPKLASGGYEVTHDTHVFAIDADDEVPVLWNADTSAADLADDISTLLKADS